MHLQTMITTLTLVRCNQYCSEKYNTITAEQDIYRNNCRQVSAQCSCGRTSLWPYELLIFWCVDYSEHEHLFHISSLSTNWEVGTTRQPHKFTLMWSLCKFADVYRVNAYFTKIKQTGSFDKK